jgi:Undecaprenyl-phosphate glucose phosphotransferase
MQTRYTPFLQFMVLLGDMLLLNLSFIIAGVVRFDDLRIESTEYYDYYVQLAVFVNLSWLLLSLLFKTYRTGMRPEPRQSVGKVLNVYVVHIFLLLLFFVSLKRSDFYSRLFLVYFYSGTGITVFLWHFYFMRLLRAYRSSGKGGRKVVFLGEGKALQRLAGVVQHRNEYGLQYAGFYSNTSPAGLPLSGDESALEDAVAQLGINEIYAAFPPGDSRWLKWHQIADKQLIRFRMVPDLDISLTNRLQIDFIERVPVFIERREPLESYHNRLLKRGFDVLVSILVILLIFPWLFPILALLVKLDGGTVFYRQKRAGLNGSTFDIYKFRSMRPVKGADDDAREVSKIGKFIRRHSLDELPQFFNVLLGNMSVVGPRPHMMSHTDQYRAQINSFMVRHFVKPGITGLAQVKGLRGEITSPEDIEARIAADVYYLENWSLLLDFRIVFTTLFKVFFPDKKAV